MVDAAVQTSLEGFPRVDGVVIAVDDAAVAADPQYSHQRDYFDAEFAGYDVYELENWRRSYLDRLDAAGLLAPGPMIDVGVGGSGYTVIEAARAGSQAVGCDLSFKGLAGARRFAQQEGVAGRTEWVCCSAEKLPFPSESFASALAIAVLEHVPDDRAAIAEIARVLRPGGRAWVTVPHALPNISPLFRPANRKHDRRMGHLRRYEAEELVVAGRVVGLNAIDVQFTGHAMKVLQLVTRRLDDRLWWWCEHHDLRRSRKPRGSMQLSVLFERAG